MTASSTLLDLPRMNFEQFVAWVIEQPEGEKYELFKGQVVRLQSEREAHAYVKMRVGVRLFEAVERSKLPCTVYVDGFLVRAGAATGFEPDVLVRCGPRPDPNALWVDDPIIVVEVLSPTTRGIDTSRKLMAYIDKPSVRHCVIVDPFKQMVIHHFRGEAGERLVRITGSAPIVLDPPGIVLERIFPDE